MYMNLKEIIKKIFKFKSEEYSLVNNLDITLIPKREIFEYDDNLIKLIEFYKNEYRKILKKRIFTSIDLKLDDSINQMKMNIELILNQCINDKNHNNIYKDIEDELKDFVIETNNLTSLSKLKLYQDEIQKLEHKNICKVIALDELSKEIRYNLSINKRNSIKNELSNLVNIMTIYKSQRTSINLEIDNYKRDIEVSSYNNYRRIDRKYKNKRFDNADKYIFVLPKEYRFIYNEYYLSVPEFTAIIERALEIYVYEHKDLIENYKSELEKINNQKKELKDKQRLTTKITKIEYIFKLFDLYGYNLVKDEDFDKLYRTKFDILTIDINNLKFSPFNISELDAKELKVYTNIISEKIYDVCNLNCIEIKKLLNILKNDFPKKREFIMVNNSIVEILGKALDNLFKTGKYFDYEKILNSHILLSLLLAFNKENGLNDFYNKVKDNTEKYIYFFENYYRKEIIFEFEISLDTICKVIDGFYEMEDDIIFNQEQIGLKSNADIFKIGIFILYPLKEMIYSNDEDEKLYKLPEGIKSMNGNIGEVKYPFLEYIRDCIKDKIVEFPSTLKTIYGKPFGDVKVNELILNEGLEYIANNAFYNQDALKVVIPSTLENINIGTFNWEKIENLEFTNFKNSKTLKKLLYSNDNQYKEILKKLFKVERDFYSKILSGCICLRLYDELGQKSAVCSFSRYSHVINRQDLVLIRDDIELIRTYLIDLIYEETGYKIEPINEEKNKILKK